MLPKIYFSFFMYSKVILYSRLKKKKKDSWIIIINSQNILHSLKIKLGTQPALVVEVKKMKLILFNHMNYDCRTTLFFRKKNQKCNNYGKKTEKLIGTKK